MKSKYKKKYGSLFILCVLLMFMLSAEAQAAPFSGGNGTSDNPYIITTAAELDNVHDYMWSHFKLSNDIDLTAYLAPGGVGNAKWSAEGWEPIGNANGNFIGSFDGNGHKVTGLWINRSNTAYIGLFGVTSSVEIRNLGVEIAAAGVNGNNPVGGLVGQQSDSKIENCYAIGNVSGNGNVGGLVGFHDRSSIVNSYSMGEVTGTDLYVGGLVGEQWGGSIENCYSTGNVTSTSNSVGGLAGRQWSGGNIKNCYSTGNVTSTGESVGGLVGWQDGDTTNCYATGNVTSTGDSIGGLVGWLNGDTTNCYTTGNVSGGFNVGGLVGIQEEEGNITNSYRYQFVTVNGVVRTENTSNDIHGGIVTATELMTRATYEISPTNWKFTPSGPWHWDDRKFPKLDMGKENFPFGFKNTLKVSFQGRPDSGDANIEKLTVKWISGNAVIAEETVTTNHNGEAEITIPPQNSDLTIWVKGERTLAVSKDVETIELGSKIDVGTLPGGDCNGDNMVDQNDFSVFVSNYGRDTNFPGFNRLADFNNDGKVDLDDFSIFSSNYGLVGAQLPEGASLSAMSFINEDEESNSGGGCNLGITGFTLLVMLTLPLFRKRR